MLNSLFSFIAPHSCYLCKKPGTLFCELCVEDEISHPESVCYRCNKLSTDFKTCRSCRSSSHVYAALKRSNYEGYIKDLIHDTKFGCSRQGAKDLGRIVSDIVYESRCSFDLVAYVPTSASRVRQRGFDHAKDMATVVAARSRRPLFTGVERQQNTRQLGATRSARKSQVSGAFLVQKGVKDKTVLLVDDVISTGATIEEVALVLRLAGAKRVIAVAAAHNL